MALASGAAGKVAREAGRLVASAGLWAPGQKGGGTLLYQSMLEQAVRCRDPFVRMDGYWLLRRLSPIARIELTALPRKRDEGKVAVCHGLETANVHLASAPTIPAVQRDLARAKIHVVAEGGEGDDEGDSGGLERLGGAPCRITHHARSRTGRR